MVTGTQHQDRSSQIEQIFQFSNLVNISKNKIELGLVEATGYDPVKLPCKSSMIPISSRPQK